ncbi:cysteine protease StiP family protein [Planococcus lenghuensis]|uniref:Uncharacterized protein n=1 Tax=Planococcus lenghuensis TaxID=2213202 RepID=A0A1Q2KWC4_9BACL|nr:cysteine protease StiP family protein [Planococcus lenghuensis]AQQ52426.1 hypothetical protein B0X71_04410 [Planococcus lenghuensis]
MKLDTAGLVPTSYDPEDIIFLLKDLSDATIEAPVEEREQAFRKGSHYSESLPVEYRPTAAYTELYHQALAASAEEIARLTGVLARRIRRYAATDEVVLVSLARAGSPVGILLKRYAKQAMGLDWPHFSVSILRGKGIDAEALQTVRELYPESHIQFVDGWTGKGAIQQELSRSVGELNADFQLDLNDDLAVLSDPGACSTLFGTREDFLIPNACLNATVSGLVSRTVLNTRLIRPGEFHGAKYYADLETEDVSNDFIDRISSEFNGQEPAIEASLKGRSVLDPRTWQGMEEAESIAKRHYLSADISKVKPSVGETTRVLLRRQPYKVLVQDSGHEAVQHILYLCREKEVPVEEVPDLFYRAIGLIEAEDRR